MNVVGVAVSCKQSSLPRLLLRFCKFELVCQAFDLLGSIRSVDPILRDHITKDYGISDSA